MKIRHLAPLAIMLALAACSDPGVDPQEVPPPGVKPPAATIQGRIGANFASFFEASNTSDPRDPVATDVPPVNPAADPLDN